MKNIFEVLRQKEQEYQNLGKEIEALRMATRLLADEADAQPGAIPKPAEVVGSSLSSPRAASPGPVRERRDGVVGESPILRQFP
jgi:hypothetical protein